MYQDIEGGPEVSSYDWESNAPLGLHFYVGEDERLTLVEALQHEANCMREALEEKDFPGALMSYESLVEILTQGAYNADVVTDVARDLVHHDMYGSLDILETLSSMAVNPGEWIDPKKDTVDYNPQTHHLEDLAA